MMFFLFGIKKKVVFFNINMWKIDKQVHSFFASVLLNGLFSDIMQKVSTNL